MHRRALRRSLEWFPAPSAFNLTDTRERRASRTIRNTAIGHWTAFFRILAEWARWPPFIRIAPALSRRNSEMRLSQPGSRKDFPKILFARVPSWRGRIWVSYKVFAYLDVNSLRILNFPFTFLARIREFSAFPFIPIQGNRALLLNVLFFYNFSTISVLDKLQPHNAQLTL